MPGFDVELTGGNVVRIDAEDEDSAMRVARDQGAVPLGVKKTASKSTAPKKSAPKKSKKSAPKKK